MYRHFFQVCGLPCSYALDALQGNPLLLSHFHSHWYLRRDGAPQLLLEPCQWIEPIMAQNSLPRLSTKWEPSHFKIVEAQTQ